MNKQREALELALKAIESGGAVEDMMAAEKAIQEALAERELLLDEHASSQACHVAWKQCANTIDNFDGDPYGAFTMGFHAGIQASVNAKHPPAKPAAYLDLSNNIAYSMRELSNEDAYDTDAMVPLYLSPPTRKPEPEQEPVAWRIADERDWEYCTKPPLETDIQWSARYGRKYEPLYTSPPTRKPLTGEAFAEPEQKFECLTITPEEIEEICKTAGFASYAVIKMMNKFNIKLNDTNTSIFEYARMIKGALNDEQRT